MNEFENETDTARYKDEKGVDQTTAQVCTGQPKPLRISQHPSQRRHPPMFALKTASNNRGPPHPVQRAKQHAPCFCIT
eukprot:CAMPEP_0202834756 /NCGR_PEP_ID=MMETSP1389-20130828/33644_1 /ASSEMBLY_ACC=CAM_ASM_000865 /TAXON_ID=302021 /ORGANISM="Rhodomonas sp., Strain CCMP768" /LENGTH=77 /DNA_ID=CAMNT_0049510045 /DNA_START=83 /DNA_END=316 /DNA_ORIENTATION=-